MDLVPTALFVQLDSTKQPFIRKDTVYYNSMTYMEWNSEKPLFKSSKIRWALSHLIDRDQIVKNILKGVAIPLNGVINFTQPHYDASQKPITFDPELAKKMLTEEGWVDSDGDGILDKVVNGKRMQFRFTMNIYTGSDVIRQAALVIAEQMRKVGIQVDVSSTEWTVWIENNRQHNYDVSIANIGGNSTEDDPYELWHSSQARNKGQNVTSFINSEVDQILEQNRVEFDFAKRDILMKRFQKILYDELPITPLFSTPARLARIDRFDNVEFYRQRPCVNVPYWTVRGSGVVAKVGAPSTIKALHQ